MMTDALVVAEVGIGSQVRGEVNRRYARETDVESDRGMLLMISAVSMGAAALTFVTVEWLRHRSYLQYRESGDVLSTQPLVVKGLLIGGSFEFIALVCLVFWLAGHS
jgi:hypothetical protein